jgi:hypothetical protein
VLDGHAEFGFRIAQRVIDVLVEQANPAGTRCSCVKGTDQGPHPQRPALRRARLLRAMTSASEVSPALVVKGLANSFTLPEETLLRVICLYR